jgi:ribokinase
MVRGDGWDVVVVGGVNTDYLAGGPTLPTPGTGVEGDVFDVGPGGKGATQAVAAARLGARVAVVARVGADDRGEALLAYMKREGVDTRYVARDPQAPTGVALLHVDARGTKQSLSVPGANRRLTGADVQAAAAALSATKVVLSQLEVPLEAVMAGICLGCAAGARILLDPAPPRILPDELLRLVDVLKPNAHEAEALTGVQVEDRSSARQAAEHLLAHGVSAVAVQAGEEGNLLGWREAERWLPKVPVASVDSTGAGDAFAAALAVAWAEGRTLEEAGPFASAAAALATTALGAQVALPRRDTVYQLLMRLQAEAYIAMVPRRFCCKNGW